MINNNNTIIITTTIPTNKISEKRRNNLITNFSKWNIPLVFNDYINPLTRNPIFSVEPVLLFLVSIHDNKKVRKYNL